MNLNIIAADPVIPGKREGRIISARGNQYRLVDDQERIFRATGPMEKNYRKGENVLVLSGVIINKTGKGKKETKIYQV